MHRIEQHDKQQGLAMAWHGLTEIVADLSLNNCWLATWDIVARPLRLVREALASTPLTVEAMVQTIETPFALLSATDNPAITIGVPFNPESYRPITNKEFIQLLRDSTEGIDGCQLVSIGSVRNRGRVFASFETQSLEQYNAGGRTFKPFLNFGNGHDKSSVLWANTSNICTVCDNTFSMNLASVEREVVQSVNARHTKNIVARLPEIGMLIRNANSLQRNFAAAFETLAEVKIDSQSAERILAAFVVDSDKAETLSTRASNIVARLLDLFTGGRGNKGETLADLFSAVTEYYTHENAGNTKNPWKQFNSAEFGEGQKRKASFWKLVNDSEAIDKLTEQGTRLLQDKA